MNPWGFVIKSLDLLSLECFDKSGRPLDNICNSSQKIRDDFILLFEEVVNSINLKLESLSSHWDLSATKLFPGKQNANLQVKAKDLKSTAIKLASIYLNDTAVGQSVFESCKLSFAKKLAMYESFQIKQFFNDYWNPLIMIASTNINETMVTYCEAESEVCKESLITAYTNLFLPFYAVKIPIVKLGFGQFLSYFSRFVTPSDDGYFLSSNKAREREKIIEQYLVKVYDNMASENKESFNISVFELVKVLQLPQTVSNDKISYASYFMKKFGCGGNEQEKLNRKWLDWSEKDDKTFSDQEAVHYPPCKSSSDLQRDDIGSCCNATKRLQNQLEPILRIMKYATQPPHFVETDEEMSLTFKNATFLGYPLKFPLKSSLEVTEDHVYGDGALNYNPKIPVCQYSGSPQYPTKSNCKLFSRSITNEGLGYTFNGANFWCLYHDTPYAKAFSKIMYPKEGQNYKDCSLRDGLVDAYVDAGARLPESSGPSYGLTIALHAVNVYNKISENTTFKIMKSPFKVMYFNCNQIVII